MKTSLRQTTAVPLPFRPGAFSAMSLVLSLVFASVAQGHPHGSPQPDHRELPPPRVSVEFLVAGRPLHQEHSRYGGTFVSVPRWGIDYEIRIRNHESRDRVLFVIGIDGLSVMNGLPASRQSGGYVLDPGETTRIRGWRRGHHRVAAFTFTHSDDSYASRTGRPGHVGEIWVWAIREKSHRPPVEVVPLAPGAKSQNDTTRRKARHPGGKTGTGYGDELVDHVRPTEFVRSSSLRHLTYRYGLAHVAKPHIHPTPPPEDRFTPAPPGWQRKRR